MRRLSTAGHKGFTVLQGDVFIGVAAAVKKKAEEGKL